MISSCSCNFNRRPLTDLYPFLSAGSLAVSVTDMTAPVVGSSGGVYALVSAHLANVVMVSFCVCISGCVSEYITQLPCLILRRACLWFVLSTHHQVPPLFKCLTFFTHSLSLFLKDQTSVPVCDKKSHWCNFNPLNICNQKPLCCSSVNLYLIWCPSWIPAGPSYCLQGQEGGKYLKPQFWNH